MTNQLTIHSLKAARKIYTKIFRAKVSTSPESSSDPDEVASIIQDRLLDERPLMIGRFGSTEMNCLMNYLGTISPERSIFKFVTGKQSAWWWQPHVIHQMQNWSGFFPPTIEKVNQFGKLMLQDLPLVDILASWLPQERFFEEELKHAIKIDFELLNPYFSAKPWTSALSGKKVLVVHPFAHTIKKQYNKRTLLFEKNVLPSFHLSVLKAVQSLGGQQTQFADWFEALDFMKAEIDKVDYDVCLIGAGAYGFPLAAHVKRSGKKAVHMGGSLQLLFGISGKRWEDPNYSPDYHYYKLINEHWVKASEEEKPLNADKVEDACYW